MDADKAGWPQVLVVESWDGEKWAAVRQEWNAAAQRYEIADSAQKKGNK